MAKILSVFALMLIPFLVLSQEVKQNASKNLSQIYGTRSDHEKETKSEFNYQYGEQTKINKPFFGEESPGVTPKLFAPGIISTHGNLLGKY